MATSPQANSYNPVSQPQRISIVTVSLRECTFLMRQPGPSNKSAYGHNRRPFLRVPSAFLPSRIFVTKSSGCQLPSARLSVRRREKSAVVSPPEWTMRAPVRAIALRRCASSNPSLRVPLPAAQSYEIAAAAAAFRSLVISPGRHQNAAVASPPQ